MFSKSELEFTFLSIQYSLALPPDLTLPFRSRRTPGIGHHIFSDLGSKQQQGKWKILFHFTQNNFRYSSRGKLTNFKKNLHPTKLLLFSNNIQNNPRIFGLLDTTTTYMWRSLTSQNLSTWYTSIRMCVRSYLRQNPLPRIFFIQIFSLFSFPLFQIISFPCC